MAYVNVGTNMPQKEQPKPKEQSTLSKAVDLTKTGMEASKWINQRNERLLTESGYLDLKLPTEDILKTRDDGTEYFEPQPGIDVFARKPGKGPLRKAEDRIRLTDEGKKYFENLAKKNNTFAREEYLKWIGDKGDNLENVDLGGWGLSNKKIEKLSGDDKFKDLQGSRQELTKKIDDVVSKKEVKEGMKSVLAGDVPLYDESQALQEAALGAANQAQTMVGPFAPKLDNNLVVSGNFKDTLPGVDSLISPMTGVQEPASNLGMVTSGMQNDAKRWMTKGQDFLGAPQLQGSTLPSLGGSTEFAPNKPGIFPGVLNAVQDPKKAIMDKAMSSIGLKPGLLAGMGPMGMFAQMALGKLLKPHTVAGKLFKLFG